MSTIDIDKLPAVGYGYRWLENHEIIAEGDEIHWRYPNSTGYFSRILSGFGWTVLQYKSKVNFAPEFPAYFRRKIDVEEGYRLVSAEKEKLESSDEYIHYHYCFPENNGMWRKSSSLFWTISNLWQNETSKIGLAYRRKIEITNETLMNDNLEKQVEYLTQTVKKLEEQLVEFNKKVCAQIPAKDNPNICAPEKKVEKFKVGDYIFRLVSGNSPMEIGKTYRIKTLNGFDELIVEEFVGYWGSKYFRKATQQEIIDHLTTKAAKQGFVVGAKAKHKTGVVTYIIEQIEVIFPNYEENEPFVAIYYRNGHYSARTMISVLEIVKNTDESITIKVDNVDYIAEFLPGYVKFGCAEILNAQIEGSLNFLNCFYVSVFTHGNRGVNAVQIGKGLFTKEILERMIKQLKY